MSKLNSGHELVLFASSVAILISKDLSADETNILAGLFSAIGDNLEIIATQQELSEEGSEAKLNSQQALD